MRSLPAVLASRDGQRALQVVEFDGIDRIANRDAIGYYFYVRLGPDEEVSRLAVVFSGTVFAVKPSAFGLPELAEGEETFIQFSLAAIGDYLDESGLPESTPSGVSAFKVECFSPHFQSWADRSPADDSAIESYLRGHAYWTWKFGHEDADFGMPDALRLRREIPRLERIARLHEGESWTTTEKDGRRLVLEPTSSFLREFSPGDEAAPSSSAVTVEAEAAEGEMEPPTYVYVDEVRIADLRRIEDAAYDLSKLIALCAELNLCYRSQCYHAVAALTRSVIDHVPPIFGCKSFAEVSSSYGGSRSFKECMRRLEEAGRKIADGHLHTQIRSTESLPTRTQVNFSNEVDLLLGEVVRLLDDTEQANGSSNGT